MYREAPLIGTYLPKERAMDVEVRWSRVKRRRPTNTNDSIAPICTFLKDDIGNFYHSLPKRIQECFAARVVPPTTDFNIQAAIVSRGWTRRP
ncbi:hypothetical protein TNCV_2746951 [Trichonephila clavipes]|nr:hypothetical protein TNCV_2746951 [Trichonephila clavipes]